jgi:uncharacterized membrane protein
VSNLVVILFDKEEDAGRVRQALRSEQHADYLHLDDSAVVVKDHGGHVHVRNEVDTGVKWGALGGALLGPILLFMFPVVGIAAGALGGALVGKTLDLGVDQSFVKEVSAALKPGTSALFIMVRSDNPGPVIEALKPYKGTLYQTSFSTEAEESLKRVLAEEV